MLKGIHAGDAGFLVQMNRTEQRIAVSNQQITSGIRVNQAQDDPFAVQSILSYQNQLDQLSQLQTNMNLSKNDATYADGALQTASNIMDQLVSIGTQGASDLTTPDTRANLAIQAQQLAQQLVGVANTQIGSRYIFGGDNPSVKPYTYNPAATPGALQNNTSGATITLRDSSGTTQQAGMTAKDVFDNPSGSVFKAAYDLVQSLSTGGTTATTNAAITELKAGSQQLANVTVFYGNVETWIQNATDRATAQTNSLTATLSSLRDTDLPTAITNMTSNQVSLQAALSAHASLSSKTLFDYMG